MRKFSLICGFLFLIVLANAQQLSQPQPATDDFLKLKVTEYNFNQIPQGKPVYYNFEITNTGKTELKLDDVRASCGCTTRNGREPVRQEPLQKLKLAIMLPQKAILTSILH